MGLGDFWDGSCGCILAQVDGTTRGKQGEYSNACYSLGLDPWGNKVVSLGFYSDGETDDYPLLTEAWLEVLREKPAS